MTARRSMPPESSPTVVALSGEIDLCTGDAVRRRLTAALCAGDRVVVVDLSRVTFCDAGGLGLLVAAHRRARTQGVTLWFRGPGPRMTRLLNITGLRHSLPLMG
ncbi:anti-sigma factor antagonist [Nonomuraea terrae]|uniref:Anti-sigma factor antagonist n=1 Tax=Nonomuraea terrae TaxID=2530383 RepID=A0A4R4YMY0_9ACTN|nr:STAS domain-containing protein [Nonomuraea terrae]TDD46353.1 anti-sigma factor antagonist [Nonomuraea terrae]